MASPTREDIDTAIQLGLAHPMGPLRLSDLIGLDTVLSIGEVLHRAFGEERYDAPAVLRSLVAEGKLGRKTGRGLLRLLRVGRGRVSRSARPSA